MTDKMREEFEAWATTFFDGATQEMLKDARCPEGTEAYIFEGNDNAGIYLTAAYLGWKAARDAAPDVQGEPVAYRVTGPYTDVPFKDESSAKAYCRGLLIGHPEGGYRITPLYTAPQPAEQRCEYCDGTGDVHSIDGEWRGACDCQLPAPDVSGLVEALTMARETIAFALRKNAPDHFTTDADIARHVDIQRIDSALADHRKGGEV